MGPHLPKFIQQENTLPITMELVHGLFMVLWNPNDQEYRYNKFIIFFFVIPLLYAFVGGEELEKSG
jgi:hypothetical protein